MIDRAKSMRDVVVFGDREFASVAADALRHDGRHNVVGFTVDGEHQSASEIDGLPVVPFDRVTNRFNPSQVGLLVAIGWQDMNELRRRKTNEAIEKGYEIVSHVSKRALIANGISLGRGAMIFEGAIIQHGAEIRDGVIIRSGCQINHHTTVGEYSFLASNAVTGGGAAIGAGCFVGLNATIVDHVSIAPGVFIAAGAVVTSSITHPGKYVGIPARLVTATSKS